MTGDAPGRSVELEPSTDPARAVQVLLDAAREGGNLLGRGHGPIDLFNAYLGWAAAQERMLRGVFGAEEIDRLLTTRRYWTLQVMDPIKYGPAISDLIALEVNARVAGLEAAADSLRKEIDVWRIPSTESHFSEHLHAVVVDTNVLMRSKGQPTELDWSELASSHPSQGVAIVIPAAVVEELDGLKHAHGKMIFGGESHERSWLATLALRWLQDTFSSGDRRVLVRDAEQSSSGIKPRLHAVLMIEALDHVPFPKVDSEIIETALRLRPLARTVTLVSYDAHMIFTARGLGLTAVTPPEPPAPVPPAE